MNATARHRLHSTAAILAGGRGARLGGRDKGWVAWRGRALVEHQLDALRPQSSALLISANRNLARYRALGVRVVTDAEAAYLGPLAGMSAICSAAGTPWIVCVPCDVVGLPPDTVARLIDAAAGRGAAYARSHEDPIYPLCAFERQLAPALAQALAGERRSVRSFLSAQDAAEADFSDCALRNLNTPQALEAA